MLLALIAVIIFFSFTTNGAILLPQNINNLISQNAYVFILGVGMLLCILTGGNIDLSVGSVLCFTAGIGAVMMQAGIPWLVSVIAMLVVGLLIGVWQAYWVAYINVPPFIVTLAGMYAFRGLSNVVLQGYAVQVSDTTFLNLFGGGADCYVPDFLGSNPSLNLTCMVVGVLIVVMYAAVAISGRMKSVKKGYPVDPIVKFYAKLIVISAAVIWISYKLAQFKGIPTVLIWIALLLLGYAYLTQKTRIGRYLYAVGGNAKATGLSGINTKKVMFFAYVNIGFLSAVAGITTLARATSAQPTYGQGYEMDAIAACFVGGASAYGGIGTVFGTIIGALLMGVINQGMSIMGVDSNYQNVVKGLVLLAAVVFDVVSKREKK
ncbi:MAG: sugar ABC transporter permease [Pseudobutyrivibrio sp.]|nr:sugar ABC transporter permease [Pseudobutyrivibrio sp.]